MRYRPGNRLNYVKMRAHAVGEVEEKMNGVIFQVVFDPNSERRYATRLIRMRFGPGVETPGYRRVVATRPIAIPLVAMRPHLRRVATFDGSPAFQRRVRCPINPF